MIPVEAIHITAKALRKVQDDYEKDEFIEDQRSRRRPHTTLPTSESVGFEAQEWSYVGNELLYPGYSQRVRTTSTKKSNGTTSQKFGQPQATALVVLDQ
jgi:hypothetical protein